MILSKKLIFAIFLFINYTHFAQITSQEFERISIDQGLSNNSINSVLQTSNGFLWIATKDGLNRFDGKTFKVFKSLLSDTTSLPQNYVMTLFEDKNKTLWVGTWGGGLCSYNAENENFTSYNFPQAFDDYVQCLFEDNISNIWIGTLNGGLNKISSDRKSITNYSNLEGSDFSFPSNNITSIIILNHSLWIGTWESGLINLNVDDGTYNQFSFNNIDDNGMGSDLVWDIFQKSDNTFLLSTNNGIVEFDIRDKTFKKYFTDLTFRQIISDSKGRMWAGSFDYQGLYVSNLNDGFNHKTTILRQADDNPSTLTSDRIRWIYEDKLKNIWIGTEDGLNKLPLTKDFFQYKYFPLKSTSIGGRVVSSIIEGKNNILWVGFGGGGFDRINLENNKIKHFVNKPNDKNSLSANDVVNLFEDKEGLLWIGTSYGGLNRYNTQLDEFKSYISNPTDTNSIKSNWVHQIIELNSAELLIGTNESLEIFNKYTEQFTIFSPELNSDSISLPNRISVNSLLKDSKNNIWIGTWLDGLYFYNSTQKTLDHYSPEKGNNRSISSNKITSIFEDSKNHIWVGTHSGGLNKFNIDVNEFIHFNTQNGLPNDVVFGILEDNNGFLWVSTMKGLVKINPQTEHFRIYDKSDGIINNQFNWHAYFKSKNGKMYFGGINGFVSFNPNSIEVDSNAMPVKFISFRVNNKEILNSELLNKNKCIELDYYENFFSIDFMVLDFIPSLKHNYLYKLNGLDVDWIQAGENNLASYTDIKPGEYNFIVKASNADGIWSDETELTIIINPAWWMTWWFRIFLIFGLGAIAFFIYKFRINQLLKIERIRLNISRDLHDEIGSNLSSISIESQLLMENDQIQSAEKEHLSIIKNTSIATMQAMRDIIWFINPENEWSADLILKMKEAASHCLVGIKWSFNCSKQINLSGLNLEAKRNIFLIYKEVLTNIAKHSKAKNCIIKIDTLPKLFKMTISDDGVGFDYETLKRKSGLINIQKRADEIKGKIEIKTNINKGTIITFEINK